MSMKLYAREGSPPSGIVRMIVIVAVAAFLGYPGVARAQSASPAKMARVAVFAEAGFPAWVWDGEAAMPPPSAIVHRLQALGIDAEAVDAATLADASKFNSVQYNLLVLPYGNCYPKDALQNLQSFHREGGGLVVTGIPFTHPAIFEKAVADTWWANPGWGEKVHAIVGGGPHGENALYVQGRDNDWSGGSTERFSVQVGATLRTSVWVKDVSGRVDADDQLFVRFYDQNGTFVSQAGVPIGAAPDWQAFLGNITVPDKAAKADLSPQIFNHLRTLLMSDFTVTADGKTNLVPNGTLTRVLDRWRDLGDQGNDGRNVGLFGPNGVGVGGFSGPDGGAKPYTAPADDPLHIRAIGYTWKLTGSTQWFDPASLPKGDTVVPLVGTHDRPIAALIVHNDADYQGVVDAWTFMGPGVRQDITGTGQMIVRGVVAALAQKKLLTPARAQACYTALNRLVDPQTSQVGKTSRPAN